MIDSADTVLPDPLSPTRASVSPLCHLEADVLDDVQVALCGGEVDAAVRTRREAAELRRDPREQRRCRRERSLLPPDDERLPAERVAKPVTDEIEREHSEGDRDAGWEQAPGVAQYEVRTRPGAWCPSWRSAAEPRVPGS